MLFQVRYQAEANGVCLALDRELPAVRDDAGIHDVIESLLRYSRARVVISFMYAGDVAAILRALKRAGFTSYFLWFFSDSFEFAYLNAYDMESIVVGSFLFTIHAQVSQSFRQYFETADTYLNTSNDWFDVFWSTHYGCNVSDGSCLGLKDVKFSLSAEVPLIVDAINVYAHALHQLISDVCPEVGKNKRKLNDCLNARKLILEYMKNVSFHGNVGHIKFDAQGYVMGTYKITHIIGNSSFKEILVGTYQVEGRKLSFDASNLQWSLNGSPTIPDSVCSQPCAPGEYFVNEEVECCWDCRKCRENEVTSTNGTSCVECPRFWWRDRMTAAFCAPLPPQFISLSDPIAIIFACISLLCIAACVQISIIFVKKRNTRLIKACSRELTSLIMAGVVFTFSSVFLFLLRPDFYICALQYLSFDVSFAFVYSPLLVKVNRICRIFTAGQKGQGQLLFTSSRSQLAISGLLIGVLV